METTIYLYISDVNHMDCVVHAITEDGRRLFSREACTISAKYVAGFEGDLNHHWFFKAVKTPFKLVWCDDGNEGLQKALDLEEGL